MYQLRKRTAERRLIRGLSFCNVCRLHVLSANTERNEPGGLSLIKETRSSVRSLLQTVRKYVQRSPVCLPQRKGIHLVPSATQRAGCTVQQIRFTAKRCTVYSVRKDYARYMAEICFTKAYLSLQIYLQPHGLARGY